ncbi:MAG TPA: ABC transporter permease [Bradyrhizobium sp.]|nr:ABC transporter permease [Bradyrhizobium sp.]
MTRSDPFQRNGLALRLYGSVVVVFLLLPIVVAAAVAFNGGERPDFPPIYLSLRWFVSALRSDLFMDGLGKSLIIAFASTVLAATAGSAAAIAINHYRFPGRTLIQTILMLPVALPAIVLGLGMLFSLPMLGLNVGLVAATLGHAVLGIPYVIAMVSASLASFDRSLERASLNLGVGPLRTFFRITLPHIRPGVIAGAIASFLLSMDNISLSLFITRNDTLPLRLMQHMLSYTDPSVAAMSVMLLLISLALLLALLPFLARGRAG